MKRPLALAALLLGFTLSFASATTYRALTLDELISRTELGFFGKVSALDVTTQAGEPYTQVTFDVLRRLTGDLGAPGDTSTATSTNTAAATAAGTGTDTVTLNFYGGTLPNGRSVKVEGMPEFNRGDDVLVFTYNAPYYSPIVGFSQGFWRATPGGFRDLNGRLLSLSDDGNLLRDGEGSDQTAVLDELEARFGEVP